MNTLEGWADHSARRAAEIGNRVPTPLEAFYCRNRDHKPNERRVEPTEVPATIVNHDSWNRARVFLGEGCERKALAFIAETMSGWEDVRPPGAHTPGEPTVTSADVQNLWETGELHNWTIEEGFWTPTSGEKL